jgi:A/G-specific adenine glycosylase
MTVAATTTSRKRAAPKADDLLAWYDRHRRVLPWRAKPGEAIDPYRVWLSEIMLQQTTVKAVAPYFTRFLARWPDVATLAAAQLDDVLRLWAGLGYYARARNLHACAQAVAARGAFPRDESELTKLPGVGRYTAAAIAAIAFDARTVPVDGNVERVVTRLFAIEEELPAAKPEVHRLAQTLAPDRRAGDFAQAMMDLGATLCTPVKPACALCPWTQACAARQRGDAETFPRKPPKRAGQLRRGAAFVAVRADGHVLVRSRPPQGLLGGMTEVPTTDWSHDFREAGAVYRAPRFDEVRPRWRRLPGVVTHVFTHFPLQLLVYTAKVEKHVPAPFDTRWVAMDALPREALPNVMRKVLAHALDASASPRVSPAQRRKK